MRRLNPGRASTDPDGRPRRVLAARLVFALCAGCLGPPAHGADRPATTGAPVELPPMLVEESVSSVPWLYVHAGGTEFLSRCSASTTRQFVEAVLARQQLVPVLVPPEFLARMDVPTVCVLYAQDLQQTVSAEIQRQLEESPPEQERSRDGEVPRVERVNIAPNMRLMDRDMHATIVYLDEALFDGSTLSLAPGHVRYLVQQRVPDLPGWLVDGIERTYRGADFVAEPITVRPLVWSNSRESDARAGNPASPRALLPAVQLFGVDRVRAGVEREHPRRAEARALTQALFVRWAILSGGATRDAFWKFAARAAEGSVTEEMFEESFGFGFSELRDRLSDYLPKAVRETQRIRPGRLPPPPRIEVERATPNQVARIRGEWERLAIGYVRHRLPQVREPYIAQARRTLRRAYDAGDRDPRLLATMGLCEIDAGNDAGAREFLEPAVAAGVVRPRAYYELARLRFDEVRSGAPETKVFTYTEIAPVLEPLRRGLTQSPPLPEGFVVLAEAWARCEMPPNTAELAELARGARLFARRPSVGYPIARAFARHGKPAEAAAVLEACAGYPADEETRTGIVRLHEAVTAAMAEAAADR